ncbi:hypothetical protein Pan153_31820 [Gimesia panareensis]|uniref:Uncharacterized protein n=1 Tax=Gimesia panareensis TaxID=2527978 RepID=A0A518FQ89_9PLAN|nr:hypothetical protein [Gimesia panareensis]QDV18524.1 hypothetical protein Pan153_31820 [Gimesia panareensis]
MKLLTNFWRDEAGLVMSAELVLLGTVGVIGATVGISAASTAINDELVEFSHAIRSLDQSYEVQGHTSCRAWTASSSYRQQDVDKSLADLCGQIDRANRAVEKKREMKRKAPPKSSDLRKKMEAKKRKAKQQKKNEA